MKRFFTIFILISLLSCNILDVKPYQSIDFETAITTKNDVIRAVNGIYSAFQATGYYGREYILACDLAADNLRWTGTTVDYNQIYQNTILSNNTIIESIWAAIYNSINRANVVLSKLDNVKNLTEAEKNSFKAEILFLRSLAYFDLVRMFGSVPLRLDPVLDAQNVAKPRASVVDIYKQIISDLRFSAQNAKDFFNPVYASKLSAKALLARVYLYRYRFSNSSTDLDSAIFFATAVINEKNQPLQPFNEIFPAESKTESIFEIEFNPKDNNRLAQYFAPISLNGRNEVRPTDSLINAFTVNDLRKNVTIKSANDGQYGAKYLDISQGADNVYVLRLAEMYLIRAEAKALLQREFQEILADIIVITDRAGISIPNYNNYQDILNEILRQRRLEFAFEAHRWFDLVRMNKVSEFKPSVTDSTKYVFPIPLSEIQANNLCTQNSGY